MISTVLTGVNSTTSPRSKAPGTNTHSIFISSADTMSTGIMKVQPTLASAWKKYAESPEVKVVPLSKDHYETAVRNQVLGVQDGSIQS